MKASMMAASFAHLLGRTGRRAEEEDEDKREKDEESKKARRAKAEDDEDKKDPEENPEDEEEAEDSEEEGSDADSEDDDEDDKEKPSEKSSKKSKRAEGDKDDEEEDDEGEDDEKEMKGKGARACARRRERARCAAIFSCKAAATRPDVAAHLAFETTLPRSEAVALLKSVATEPAVASKGQAHLSNRMAALNVPRVGSDAVGPGSRDQATSLAAKIIAAGKKRRGEI